MTNLQRLTGKIFGETATATGDDPQIGQFGSALNGTYVGTTDVATIQSLPAWSNGFIDSVTPNEQFPPLPEMTGFGKVLSYQTAYTLQKGIPEWDPGTTYYTGDFCKGIGEGKLYVSKIDSNINNDLTDTNSWEEFSSGSSRNIGEIVTSTILLTDAGLHLLDGALINGSGSYSTFVDYIADLYNTSTNKYSNVTKIGSVVDTDGVLSGFSASNYVTLPQTFNPSSSNWEVVVPITTSSSFVECDFFASVVSNDFGIHAQLAPDNKIHLYLSSNGTSHNIASNAVGASTLSVNTKYYIKIVFTGSAYIVYSSTTGEFNGEEITQITVNSSAALCTMTTTVLGRNPNPSYPNSFNGSIDLNGCYINIDGQRWWDGRQTVGFVTEDEWQQSVTDYGICGKFVYDSVNNTVRLPKYNSKIYTGGGNAPVKGNGKSIGVTDGITNFGLQGAVENGGLGILNPNNNQYNKNVGTAYTASASGFTAKVYGLTLDGTKSGIITDLSNITTSLDCYYYIVIATSTKTDIQVDIDEIATDLNGKADVDLTNVNNSGTSRGAGWAMPSDTYVDLTFGAIGTRYTAPANGYVQVAVNGINNTSGYIAIQVREGGDSNKIIYTNQTATTTNQGYIYISPVVKGQTFYLYYANINTSTSTLKFIYAQGSESEVN